MEEGCASPPPLVMIVEDSAVVALDLEFTLLDAGYRVLGPAPTLARGLELLLTARPDFAVLDFDLGGEPVTSIALRLRAMRVPFVLASAHPKLDDDGAAAALRGVTNLGKPLRHRALLDTIAAAVRQ
ncbi:response regulator [Desertibaculum subflavum]|uniref:response regulator n=1 Tax=Desertibaculum subflavum TaxID=2268458 RepID=UPI000E667FE6